MFLRLLPFKRRRLSLSNSCSKMSKCEFNKMFARILKFQLRLNCYACHERELKKFWYYANLCFSKHIFVFFCGPRYALPYFQFVNILAQCSDHGFELLNILLSAFQIGAGFPLQSSENYYHNDSSKNHGAPHNPGILYVRAVRR